MFVITDEAKIKMLKDRARLIGAIEYVLMDLNSSLGYETRIILQAAVDDARSNNSK